MDEAGLKDALCAPERTARQERRARRAERTRAQALSPVRILAKLLLMPVVVVALTLSIYLRTSPYGRQDALRHLAALTGCDTARAMGLAGAMVGELGYHARNDPDGDGVACPAPYLAGSGPEIALTPHTYTPAPQNDIAPPRMPGGAKFVSP